MKIIVAFVGIFLAGIYILIKSLQSRSVVKKLKKWAKENNLNYQKKVKLGIIRFEKVSVKNLIWGEYNNRRIYIFEVKNSTGKFSQTYFYFNGGFYSKIDPNDIEPLLVNKNYLNQIIGIFGNETMIETVQVLVSQVYLQFGNKVEYNTAKEIFNLLLKFYNSKTNLGDKIVGTLNGLVRADIKYNSPEAIDFVLEKNKNIERRAVEDVANAYETLLGIYNKD